jgi:hypothetical protein
MEVEAMDDFENCALTALWGGRALTRAYIDTLAGTFSSSFYKTRFGRSGRLVLFSAYVN